MWIPLKCKESQHGIRWDPALPPQPHFTEEKGKGGEKSPACLKHMREAHFTCREALPVKETPFPSLIKHCLCSQRVGAEGSWCHCLGARPGNVSVTFSWVGHLELGLPGTAHPPLLPESEQNNSWVRNDSPAKPGDPSHSSCCSSLWAQTRVVLLIIGCSNPMSKQHPSTPLKLSP